MKSQFELSDQRLEFIESKNYIDNLVQELHIPSKKVTFYYFKVVASDLLLPLMNEIESLLRNGTEIEINLDAIYSKINLDGGNVFYPLSPKGKSLNNLAIKNNSELFDKLRTLGAEINFYNEPGFINKILPFAKRDHRKMVFIEREIGSVCYFGATNLQLEDQNDFMIKLSDHFLVEELAKISAYSAIKSFPDDWVLEVNPKLTFFLDIGRNFRSSILRKAYSMIMKARQEVIFISQLPPEPGLMIRFIAARINGASVQIILPAFSHQNVSGFPYIFAFAFAFLITKIFKMKISHCIDEYSHAKILVCDGATLLGSHNLSPFGVYSGTVEFSAWIKNEKFVNKVKNFAFSLIKKKLNIEEIYSKEDSLNI